MLFLTGDGATLQSQSGVLSEDLGVCLHVCDWCSGIFVGSRGLLAPWTLGAISPVALAHDLIAIM